MDSNAKKTDMESGDNLLPDTIMQMGTAFQKSRILLTAVELELFKMIHEDGKTSWEIAGQLGLDARVLDRLMNALCAMEILEKKGGKFVNTPTTRKFLVKDSPDFLWSLYHSNNMWNNWGRLTGIIRGEKITLAADVNERGEKWLSAFIAAMHYRASRTAPAIIAKLDLTNVSRVLDVGGGSGAFAMAFVKAKADIKATVFDLPNVIPLTLQYIEKEGFGGKVHVITGDYLKDELGCGYDLVLLSAIIHSNSVEQNIKLLAKCARALDPGGQVVIQDFIMDEERTGPALGALFAINMLVATDGGDTFTESEVKNWLTMAGFYGVQKVDSLMGNSLLIGKKR
ncbi:MAG: acetylserotonin O-methyltransferase [Acidobacteria bacterium]|nr:acetylserotonin O-methyltransferase [Acidobacteriota bacterium]